MAGTFHTSVVLETSLNISLQAYIQSALELAAKQRCLAIFDTFDVEETGDAHVTAALEGARRQSVASEDETNMAILYFWDAHKLGLTKDAGYLMSTKDAPLTAAQIERVFEQLVKHPAYRKQTVRTTDKSGCPVSITDGKVKVG